MSTGLTCPQTKGRKIVIQKLLCVTALLLSTIVHAEISKCKTASGVITYSEQPCTTGTSVGTVAVRAAPTEKETVSAKETTSRLARAANISGIETEIRTYQADKERAIAALRGRVLTIKSSNPKVTIVNSTVEAHNANAYQQIDSVTKAYDDKIANANARLEKIKTTPPNKLTI